MKYLRIKFDDGRIYEVSVESVARAFSEHLHKTRPDSFPHYKDAITLSNQRLAEDPEVAVEWVRAMDWADIEQHAQVIGYIPPHRSLADAEISISEEPAPDKIEGDIGETLFQEPFDYALARIASKGQVCNIFKLNCPDTKKPIALFAFIQGGEHITRFYMEGIDRLSEVAYQAAYEATKVKNSTEQS